MNKKWDVLGFGAVAVDDLIFVDQYPAVDSKEPICSRERHGGGNTGTALVTISRLGGNPAFYGALGSDELSAFTIQELNREGVNCDEVVRDMGGSPVYSIGIIERHSGRRTILYDVSGQVAPPLQSNILGKIPLARVVFVDHTMPELALGVCRNAHLVGVPVVADIERAVVAKHASQVEALSKVVDHLVINLEMGRQLSGRNDPLEIVTYLSREGHAAVVVTDGDQGCWFSGTEQKTVAHYPALKVEVVDTLGCGDVFHGAYAYGLAKGLNLSERVKVATIAAGLKATKAGGRIGIPRWSEIHAIMDQHG